MPQDLRKRGGGDCRRGFGPSKHGLDFRAQTGGGNGLPHPTSELLSELLLRRNLCLQIDVSDQTLFEITSLGGSKFAVKVGVNHVSEG